MSKKHNQLQSQQVEPLNRFKTNKNKLLYILLNGLCLSISLSSCNSHTGADASSNGSNLQSNHAMQSVSAKNSTEQSWSYTYNSNDLVETAKDPNGNITKFEYDDEGNLTKVTNPLNHTKTSADFDSYGNPQTVIDQNNVTTKLTYTVDGWLATSTTDGATTTFDYDAIGNITKLTFPDGNYLDYSYDDARYLTTISNATGEIKYMRDNAGNITNTTITGGGGIKYTDTRAYDELNRLLKITTVHGTQQFSYDNDNNLQTSTDGRNYKTSFTHDSLQRITEKSPSGLGLYKYSYNNNKNIDNPSVISNIDKITNYDFNGLNNLIQLKSPDSGTHNYSAYDGNGNLLQQTDANGKLINYTYDQLNRPTTITYAGDSTSNTTFTYDSGSHAVGQLTKLANQNSSTSYYYDARGNTIGEVQHIGGADYDLNYGYDKADNLTNLVYPSNSQVAYIYTNGQISKVLVNGKAINITHEPFGPINSVEYPNGVTQTIAYNSDYTIKSIKLSDEMLNREYSYYPNGQIKNISGVSNYDYSRNGELQITVSAKAKEHYYNYDYNGNRSAEHPDPLSNIKPPPYTRYTIAENSNHLLSSYNESTQETINYAYDNAGNMIKDKLATYSYDGLNHLNKVTVGTSTIATYQYNALSQRIVKDVDGKQIIFIYNSAGQLLEEYNKAQNTTRDYVYADGKLVAIMENGINLYVVTDHLNAPQMLLDSTGRNIWSATYDPFGKATITGNLKLNLRADGQYNDDETGLYYNWYRYYNPSLGRYITSDPLGLQAGMNTYIYVNGNPINYTDPMGLYTAEGIDILVPEKYKPFVDGVFNVTPLSPISLILDKGLLPNSNLITGYGDAFYFGATKHFRHIVDYGLSQIGYHPFFASGVNECSDEYALGHTIGMVQNRIMNFGKNKQQLDDLRSGKTANDARAILAAGYLRYRVWMAK